jgi:hypothetical protein
MNVEMVWGARYTLGARYLSKNTVYCIINAQYNYCKSNKGLLEKWDKDENMEVTGVANTFFSKGRLKHFVQCHVFAQSPPGRHPNDKYPLNTSHRSRFV